MTRRYGHESFAAVCAVVLAAVTGFALQAHAAGTELLPHRASYIITLRNATWGAGVTAFDGKMVTEFINACDGYTLNQRFVSQMVSEDGQVATGDLWMTTWESTNGESFRFNFSHDINGASVEKYSGTAFAAVGGATPRIEYVEGSVQSASLPFETMFPTKYIVDLLAAAEAGQMTVARKVFDGSGDGESYDAFAVIGRERPAGDVPISAPGSEVTAGLRSWPVTISYYPLGKTQDAPEYETSFRLFENGVSTDLILDFGNFSITGQIERIDTLSKPPC